jgi:hypothetical protein
VLNADGADTRQFEFNGAIDGKSYPVCGPDGAGSTALSAWTHTRSRRIHRKAPEGEFTWTEVYDKVG